MADNGPIAGGVRNPIGALRRFARPRAAVERCDLCAAPLAEDHQHLLEPATRQLKCACDACAVLFDGARNGKYRRVPRRIEFWDDFLLGDEQWASLGVPISLAFFFHDTPRTQITMMYPSPGGATEAALPSEPWDLLCQDNPRLRQLETDVEALLVNRVGGARDCYRMPIDQCYKLVGLIRADWRGLSGGTRVWQEISQFFEQVKSHASGDH